MTTILVTGAAGFIGSHVSQALLKANHRVIGLDNFNPYYDVKLKRARIKNLCQGIEMNEIDLADFESVNKCIKDNKVEKICHLGAQAGVRHALEDPFSYEKSNGMGTLNIFESAKINNIGSIVYASSSSVYGGNKKIPFSVDDPVIQPISLYAATKRSNELVAHTYHHLFGIKMTGLRFFTVYGPWGRPDMALFKFTKAIFAEKPIDVYNHGKMKRDFTYITDILIGVLSAIEKEFDYELFNLGNSQTIDLLDFISTLEKCMGKKAKKNLMPIQPGDVPETFADIEKSKSKLGFSPKIKIDEGISLFVDWYKSYFK